MRKFLLNSKLILLILALLLTLNTYADDFNREGLLHYWNGYDPMAMPQDSLPPVGIEVEGLIPQQIGRKRMAVNVARTLRSRGVYNVRITHDRTFDEEYFVYTATRHQPWHIEDDRSIQTRLGQVGAELVTPILSDPEDMSLFKEVIIQLHALGFTAEKHYCGVHVHVDFSNERLSEVLVLARLFAAIESDVLAHFAITPSRVQFASPLASHVFIQRIDRKTWGFNERVNTRFFDRYFVRESKHDNVGRLYALNLLSLLKHGTVEFRLFNSTMNPEEIELMVDFSARLVKAVRTKDVRLEKIIKDTSQEITFIRIAKALDMKLTHASCKDILTVGSNVL